jgi:hypothetical protein
MLLSYSSLNFLLLTLKTLHITQGKVESFIRSINRFTFSKFALNENVRENLTFDHNFSIWSNVDHIGQCLSGFFENKWLSLLCQEMKKVENSK